MLLGDCSGLLLILIYQSVYSSSATSALRGQSALSSSGVACTPFENGDIEEIQQRAALGPVKAVQESKHPHGTDYLFVIGLPYTGTTALLSLLSTSPEVANHCGDKISWFTCEGTWLLVKSHTIPDRDTRWDSQYPSDWNEAIEVYSKSWNTSKSVLVDKSPPNAVKMLRIAEDLKRTGKRVSFIVLSRSPCNILDEETRDEEALGRALEMASEVKKLPASQVLHIKYEQLISDPYTVATQMLDFLPQLKQLDPTIDGLNNAERPDMEKEIGADPKHAGKDESVIGYIVSKYPFDFPKVDLDPAWSSYMQTFGY